MHKDVAVRTTKKRQHAIDSYTRKTNMRKLNFTEGDFVLRGVVQRISSRKPSSRKVNRPLSCPQMQKSLFFVVESLLYYKRIEVHGRRNKLFRNSDFEVTEKLREYLAYRKGEMLVEKDFLDMRRKRGTIELLVQWQDFETDWVTLISLQQDVPLLPRVSLINLKQKGTPRQRRIAASI